MSTSLAVIDGSSYLALQQSGALKEAMDANMGEGAILEEGDLTRVPTPLGGVTKWTVPSIAGDESEDDITGILVCICRRGVLWGNDDPVEGTRPVLQTNDLVTATRSNDDNGNISQETLDQFRLPGEPERYDWRALADDNGPFGYGLGKGGHGKRAKEQRVLFILREQEPFPLIVIVQPGSLKVMKQFIVDLSKAQIPHYRAVIKLRLKQSISASGTTYSEIVPELVGKLDEATGKVVRERWTDTLSGVARAMDVDTGSE